MAELFNNKQSRIEFRKGGQSKFLIKVKEIMAISEADLAGLVGVHGRTFNGWKRGDYLMPWFAAKMLSEKSGVSLPRNTKTKDRFWYTKLGAEKGWCAVQKKYGRVPVNQEYRLEKWREWWEKVGKNQPGKVIGVRKKVFKPTRSVRLAEFVGIMMGDGGITKRQITVTLHAIDDFQYARYVRRLMGGMFRVPVAWYSGRSNGSVNALVISRTDLVDYCVRDLDLCLGDKIKHGLDIPGWVMKNKEYQKACLRGLVDTDGSLFYERHKIKSRIYSYPRLNFTSASPLLCDSVYKIMENNNLCPVKRNKDGKYRCVQIENKDKIRHYFKVIGSNNPKHINKL